MRRPLSSSSSGDPNTSFSASDSCEGHYPHEGEGPPKSSSGRDVADLDAPVPPQPLDGGSGQVPDLHRIGA
jgi:hypothetical protein